MEFRQGHAWDSLTDGLYRLHEYTVSMLCQRYTVYEVFPCRRGIRDDLLSLRKQPLTRPCMYTILPSVCNVESMQCYSLLVTLFSGPILKDYEL